MCLFVGVYVYLCLNICLCASLKLYISLSLSFFLLSCLFGSVGRGERGGSRKGGVVDFETPGENRRKPDFIPLM